MFEFSLELQVSLLLNSTSYFKALPRISPVQEDETAPRKLSHSNHSNHSPRSCRSLASPWGNQNDSSLKLSTPTSGDVGPGSLGSSSSSLLEDSPRLLPTTYTPSPPRLPRLRPVSRCRKEEAKQSLCLATHTHPFITYILLFSACSMGEHNPPLCHLHTLVCLHLPR